MNYKLLILFLIILSSTFCTRQEKGNVRYWENGKIREIVKKGHHTDVDTLLNYSELGNPVRVAFLVGDSLNGLSKYFYPNGKTHLIETYDNNKRQGDAFRYDSLGRIIDHKYYKLDSPFYIANYSTDGEIYLLILNDTAIHYTYIADSVALKYYNEVVEKVKSDSTKSF